MMMQSDKARRFISSIVFRLSLVLVLASPWLLDHCGVLDFLDALCNWHNCGYENLGYWMGYRA